MILTFRPIKVWPEGWRERRGRPTTPFRASWSDTLELLDRELGALRARSVTLQVDATERDCRLDGQLRADARVSHPGVIMTIETSKLGSLIYATDRFDGWSRSPGWQANVRAIALGLEALRRVERYGIAERGQQYAGYRELGSGIELGRAMTIEEAARLLCDATADEIGEDPDDVDRVIGVAESLYREAVKTAHPDRGGDPELFRRLTAARDLLVGAR